VPEARDYQLVTETADGSVTLRVSGRVAIANAQRLLDDITAHVAAAREVTLDLSGVEYFDSGGGAVIMTLREHLAAAGRGFRIARATPDIDGFLALVDQGTAGPAPPPAPRPGTRWTHDIGAAALAAAADWREFVSFTGEVVLGLTDAVRRPRRVRWRETLVYMQRTGIDGLPIVALISFLMGLITAFQAAVQLTQFGGDIYVANLVGLSIVRELGPLMTAIIAAGRSGAAFAAEIGTMKVSDEVDALTTMGLDRTRFLVTPKVVALVTMLPCLTLFADAVGIVGGLAVGLFWLDLPARVYLRQTRAAMETWDVFSGLVKSIAFALLIATVGCLRGLQAQAGAESVGRVTTSAIVAAIFFIILADAIFTVVLHYW
jgi:phospholipid/cholesterol/gamma-HCH transport system permease protein